jgi:hypothetical protein
MLLLVRTSAEVPGSTFFQDIVKYMLPAMYLWKVPILCSLITLEIEVLLVKIIDNTTTKN